MCLYINNQKTVTIIIIESYSSLSSLSAMYSFSSNSSPQCPDPRRQETKRGKPLHNVRKPTKKPIAPLPPVPPRIYKVAPVEFKDVVQKLTGGVELQPTRLLREVAPPPLTLHPLHYSNFVQHSENEVEKRQKSMDTCFGILSPLEFSMSPSSLAWCSAMLLSPGTLASFDPNLVL